MPGARDVIMWALFRNMDFECSLPRIPMHASPATKLLGNSRRGKRGGRALVLGGYSRPLRENSPHNCSSVLQQKLSWMMDAGLEYDGIPLRLIFQRNACAGSNTQNPGAWSGVGHGRLVIALCRFSSFVLLLPWKCKILNKSNKP